MIENKSHSCARLQSTGSWSLNLNSHRNSSMRRRSHQHTENFPLQAATARFVHFHLILNSQLCLIESNRLDILFLHQRRNGFAQRSADSCCVLRSATSTRTRVVTLHMLEKRWRCTSGQDCLPAQKLCWKPEQHDSQCEFKHF